MFRSTELEVESIETPIVLTEQSTREGMELDLLSKAIPVFQFIYIVLSKISDLSEKDLEKIIVQDAVALLLYYKATFDGNKVIGDTIDGELLPTDFSVRKESEIEKDVTIEINGKNFTPFLTLKRAVEAEKMALGVNGNELAYLSLYTFGACYVGSVKEGVNHVLHHTSSIEAQKQLDALNEALGKVSSIHIGFPKFQGRRRFNIIAHKESEKEVRAYALPFQETDFYRFGF